MGNSNWDLILDELVRQNNALRDTYTLQLKRQEFFMGLLTAIITIFVSLKSTYTQAFSVGFGLLFISLVILIISYFHYHSVTVGVLMNSIIDKIDDRKFNFKAVIAACINMSNEENQQATLHIATISKLSLSFFLSGLIIILLDYLNLIYTPIIH